MLTNELARKICPDFPFDRHILESTNPERWYKVDAMTMTLYVPPMKVLRFNMFELEKFGEAVVSFSHSEIPLSMYEWDNLSFSYPDTEEETLRWIDFLTNQPELACDIETRHLGLDGNAVLSIGFAFSNDDAVAITVLTEPVLKALQGLFDQSSIDFIWQNGKFDIARLKWLTGLDARVDEDTMLYHFVRINEKRGTHGLKDMAKLYLQAPPWDDELQRYKKVWCTGHKVLMRMFTYDMIPLKTLLPYMLRDCIATMRLYKVFEHIGTPESEFIYYQLIHASNVFAEIELAGVQVDCIHLAELAEELDEKIIEATKRVDISVASLWDARRYALETGAKSIPEEFNQKSPKQLKWLLEQVLGHKIASTDKDELDKILQEVRSKGHSSDFIESLTDLRKLNKQMDTYVAGINEVMGIDGRVRCNYNLHGTETGRLSSDNPNMQNIPRDSNIKNLFKAKKGYKLVQLDYSQAELRVLTVLCKDPFLVDIYLNDKDIHDNVAIQMYGISFTKEDRNRVKKINFGVPYGVGAGLLATEFGIGLSEAQNLIDNWFKPMPVLKKWLQDMRRKAARGEECKTPLGRSRHFVLTNENIFHVQNEFINTPIQSIASDLTLLSLLVIHEKLKDHKLDATIIATVHDSILLEVIDDSEVIAEVVQIGQKVMSETPKKYLPECIIPFKADAETGYSWGSLEKYVVK